MDFPLSAFARLLVSLLVHLWLYSPLTENWLRDSVCQALFSRYTPASVVVVGNSWHLGFQLLHHVGLSITLCCFFIVIGQVSACFFSLIMYTVEISALGVWMTAVNRLLDVSFTLGNCAYLCFKISFILDVDIWNKANTVQTGLKKQNRWMCPRAW